MCSSRHSCYTREHILLTCQFAKGWNLNAVTLVKTQNRFTFEADMGFDDEPDAGAAHPLRQVMELQCPAQSDERLKALMSLQ